MRYFWSKMRFNFKIVISFAKMYHRFTSNFWNFECRSLDINKFNLAALFQLFLIQPYSFIVNKFLPRDFSFQFAPQ